MVFLDRRHERFVSDSIALLSGSMALDLNDDTPSGIVAVHITLNLSWRACGCISFLHPWDPGQLKFTAHRSLTTECEASNSRCSVTRLPDAIP